MQLGIKPSRRIGTGNMLTWRVVGYDASRLAAATGIARPILAAAALARLAKAALDGKLAPTCNFRGRRRIRSGIRGGIGGSLGLGLGCSRALHGEAGASQHCAGVGGLMRQPNATGYRPQGH